MFFLIVASGLVRLICVLRLGTMRDKSILFTRRYRAALLDYLLGNGESGLARAYELGRNGMEKGPGLLEIITVHQDAVNSILESTPAEQRMRRLKESEKFLVEALTTFEMASRGYCELLDPHRPRG
jgi:phosphoserine phosphatase RsbU-like protein